jgi:dihydrolipoamide dehydrogenase
LEKYDLIIIGGGPAGYLAAERAGHGGLTTVLFEERSLGGTCLNEGCIPTKSLLNSAKIYAKALHGKDYGVDVEEIKLNHKDVISRKNEVVKSLVAGVKSAVRKSGATLVSKRATIKGKLSDGYIVTDGEKEYVSTNLLICAGSVPVIPPIAGLKEAIESGYALTSREILDIEKVPKSLVIVGGGVIGLEMAEYFAIAGSEVTVVEMLGKIAGPFDDELSANLQKNLEKLGIKFYLNAKVTEVKDGSIAFEKDGKTTVLKSEKALLCIGRRAASSDLGLETIGVYTERGAVATDERMATNLPGVYAAGDINAKSMLAHTAYREAEVAIANILGKKDIMRYDVIPSIIYTTPETASVGETENTAKEKGLEIIIKKLPLMYSGRYLAETKDGDGFCKVIIEKKSSRIIGVQMIGNYASELILSAGLMIESTLPVESLQKVVFAHPTVGEILREVLFS